MQVTANSEKKGKYSESQTPKAALFNLILLVNKLEKGSRTRCFRAEKFRPAVISGSLGSEWPCVDAHIPTLGATGPRSPVLAAAPSEGGVGWRPEAHTASGPAPSVPSASVRPTPAPRNGQFCRASSRRRLPQRGFSFSWTCHLLSGPLGALVAARTCGTPPPAPSPQGRSQTRDRPRPETQRSRQPRWCFGVGRRWAGAGRGSGPEVTVSQVESKTFNTQHLGRSRESR